MGRAQIGEPRCRFGIRRSTVLGHARAGGAGFVFHVRSTPHCRAVHKDFPAVRTS
ncbi:unnamed protein product [Periconia digitata]|uniref:Uncharacterized protein n=1 Tax=Periconia digitata TaxID=1303443 RepID=A0A9W4U584_9PLEO|nr:unnamed protein product [Periconia digitata]